MTFTKEKLAELGWAAIRVTDFVDAYSKMRQLDQEVIHSIARIEGEFQMKPADLKRLAEAATALPHYITALAEAERALGRLASLSHDRTHEGSAILAMDLINQVSNQALTTIRQLARGNNDAT